MISGRAFDKIAATIRKQYDEHDEHHCSTKVALEDLAADLAESFADENPRFDQRRFHQAALGHLDAFEGVRSL